MNDILKNLEKEKALVQLKVDLVSRFYPFDYEVIIRYKDVLNFDHNHLMENDFIQWDYKLVKQMKDKIYFPYIWKLKNFKFDYKFFKNFESVIDFKSIHYSKNIVWSKKTIEKFGDRFDWSKSLIAKQPLSTIENVRKFKDKLDWSFVSRNLCLSFTDDVILEFNELWVWKKLSANPNLKVTVEFIQKHVDKLDFDALSRNPASIDLIYKYPTSTRWNWECVIVNPGIIYNQDSFNFIYGHYEKFIDLNDKISPKIKEFPLQFFISKIIMSQSNDISFFTGGKFIKFIPWYLFSKFCVTKFDLFFIVEYKEKLNFKEPAFIKYNKDVITTEFIKQNYDLFDPLHYSFYDLPLTIELIQSHIDSINWKYLSSCVKLDWTMDFIIEHFYILDLDRLSVNKGVYDHIYMQL